MSSGKDNAVQNAHDQVKAVVSNMQDNMTQMAQRDVQLSNLDGKTETFAATS